MHLVMRFATAGWLDVTLRYIVSIPLLHAPPPSSERLNGLALMTIHKDIHFKYDDVIDQYVMQQNRRLQFK